MSVCLNKLGLILIGKTGVGKSALGNFLLQKKPFTPGLEASSVSKKADSAISNRGNIQVTVVDTPGLYSTDLSMINTSLDIQNSITKVGHAFFVFLLVIKFGRFTPEDSDTIDILKIMFGQNVLQHTIIIFTHEDQAANEEQTIESLIQGFTSNPKRKELFEECNRNYLSVNSYERSVNIRESKWSILLQMVMSITQNGEKLYKEDLQVYKKVLHKYAQVWTSNRLTADQMIAIMRQQFNEQQKQKEELEKEIKELLKQKKEDDKEKQELQRKAETKDIIKLGAGVVLGTAGVAALAIGGAPLLAAGAIKGATAIGSAIAANSVGITVVGPALGVIPPTLGAAVNIGGVTVVGLGTAGLGLAFSSGRR